ncbi:MAG: NHLP leader peptide family RiPP precursor [Pseudanabaenaceae cyanobacterium]
MTKEIRSLDDLMQLAQTDANFRQELLSNPKAALASVGVNENTDAELTVLEESDKEVYLIIPPAEDATDLVSANDPIAQLLGRAATDEALRQEMLADPKGVIARETGMVIPEEASVSVFQQTPQNVYLILPRPASGETDRELTEEELATVAGGFWGTIIGIATKFICPRTPGIVSRITKWGICR